MTTNIMAYANRFRRYYSRAFQPLAESLGLSQLEVDILLFLHNNPSFNTARDIVAMRGFAKSNVSNAVESLREKGYLTIETDQESRRVKRLRLPPEKNSSIASLCACQQECLEAVFRGFTPEERRFLKALLERADENITEALKSWEEDAGNV